MITMECRWRATTVRSRFRLGGPQRGFMTVYLIPTDLFTFSSQLVKYTRIGLLTKIAKLV